MDSQGKAKVALTFALYQGDQLVRRDTIAQDIVKVGKDPRSHLRVDDELASRMHAVIEVASPADITLIDLGNEPGTLVNGQRVNKCKIRPGDQIQIGSTLIVLENAEPATALRLPRLPRAAACAACGRAGRRRRPCAAVEPLRRRESVRGRSRRRAPTRSPARNPFAAPAPAPQRADSVRRAADAVRRAGRRGRSADGVWARAADGRRPHRLHVLDGEERSRREPGRGRGRRTCRCDRGDGPLGLERPARLPPRRRRARSTWARSRATRSPATTSSRARRSARRARPIVVSRGVGAALVILPRSRGYVDVPGQGKVTLADLDRRPGRARPSGGAERRLRVRAAGRREGAHGARRQLARLPGERRQRGQARPGRLARARSEPAAFLYTGLSFLLHMGLVAVVRVLHAAA